MATVPVDGPALGPGNRWLWGVDPSSLALARVGPAGGGTAIARRIMVQREIGMAEAFTPAGLDALRAMAGDHRQLDPVKYAHLREELGLAPPETIATGNTRE